MSAFVVIECDDDRCRRTHDDGAPDKRTARRWARRDGWVMKGYDDFCPEHVAALTGGGRDG